MNARDYEVAAQSFEELPSMVCMYALLCATLLALTWC
jgi:hypothetical protein